MEIMLRELIGISNNMIIYNNVNSKIAETDLEERKGSNKKVVEIIAKFI